MFRNILIFSIIIIIAPFAFAQNWVEISFSEIEKKGLQPFQPSLFKTYAIDDQLIKEILWKAPHESNVSTKNSTCEITLPIANGKLEIFKIVRYDMMESGLAEAFPDIRTFHGVSKTDGRRRVKIDYTVQGIRAIISGEEGKTFIDHFQRNDKNSRIVYFKNDYKKRPKWECWVEDHDFEDREGSDRSILAGDCNFRTYRFALATTGEYSNYHGGTDGGNPDHVALVLSAVTTAMNRVNGVFEEDAALRLVLVNNTTSIFFYDGATDPYDNGDGGAMLGQNQTTCDNIIGTANYDLGHVFSTGGGGVAYIQALCNANIKAGGVTGQNQPEGDPFSIDYVAHEIGHQFSAQHTQNNSCQRSNNSAMEPGSASTIMGYAGICNPNVQNNSDAYFHAVSIGQIKNRILNTSCANFLSFPNDPPIVNNLTNRTIPISTPFFLTAVASDPNGDELTYNWEQMNNTVATMPPLPTNTGGPAFRSLFATSSPTRYFPSLTNVINNTPNTWEVLPSVGRTMNFRVTVRDYYEIGGCNTEKNVVITTAAGIGPFTVTSFNSATTMYEGDTITINWNVANTTSSPVSCGFVDILLSYNGGHTYPITLLSQTVNSGTAEIIIPEGTTTRGRIMIKCSNNIFYDINDTNFTIDYGFPNFIISPEENQFDICNTQSINTTLNIESILGYNEPVNLSITNGLPTGATYQFSPNPVIPGESTTLTIENFNTQFGIFYLDVIGQTINKINDTVLTLNIISPFQSPELISPANGATQQPNFVTFAWNGHGSMYTVEIAIDPQFEYLIGNYNTTNNSLTITEPLEGFTLYYWRVTEENLCGIIQSETHTFTTWGCFSQLSTDVPKVIPPTGTPTVNSYMTIGDRGTLTDLDVIKLIGTHTWISDLRFTLISPANTTRIIWNQPCADQDDFNINFDDSATSGNWPCPPTNGLTYRPSNTLDVFNNQPQNGIWNLRVQDLFNQDGGQLNSWGLKYCMNNFCRLTVNHPMNNIPGSFNGAMQCAMTGDTIRFLPSFSNDSIYLGNISFAPTQTNLIIDGSSSENIHIFSTASSPLFTIPTNARLTIKGLHIHSTTSNLAGVIQNNGILTLEDVTFYNNGNINVPTVNNVGDGRVIVIGNCQILNE